MSMNNQNNFDRKKLVARNFRFLCDFRGISQDDVVKKTGIPRQNVNVWYNIKGNPNPDYFDKLSKLLGVPQHTFLVENLTKEYLEKNLLIPNGTHEPKPNDNKKMEEAPDLFKTITIQGTDYLLVPKALLQDKHRITSVEQMANDAKVIDALLINQANLLAKVLKLEAQHPAVEKTK